MIAIEVTLLTGRYVATAHHDRREHEWPPHPARLFAALVATWADSDDPDPVERHALEWLEGQPHPAIAASRDEDVAVRRALSHFVPVNDAAVIAGAQYRNKAAQLAELFDQYEDELESSKGELTSQAESLRDQMDKKRDVGSIIASVGKTNPDSARQMLPDGRGKQERQFPSVTPAEPRVVYSWTTSPDSEVAASLDGLLDRVARVGHSSSLVSCRLVDDAPRPTLRPGTGTRMLRGTQRGQLEALEQMHLLHAGVRPRSLPFVGVSYGDAEPDDGETVAPPKPDMAGEMIVFELPPSQRRHPMSRTVELTEALRGAVFHHATDPLPEGLSGHLPDGTPTRDDHIAFLVLPFVGSEHADGRILGVAVMLPAGLDAVARTATLRSIGNWEWAEPERRCRIKLSGGRVIDLERKQPPLELRGLRPHTWSRTSRDWATATPIALPKNPGRLAQGSAAARTRAWTAAEEQVRQSCLHVGLPEPEQVAVSLNPFISGARRTAAYPPFVQGSRRGEGVRRRLVHARVRFEQAIEGPVVLGAGRFLGMGLMRPIEGPPTQHDSAQRRDGHEQ
ncbi:type I-G CRISPR-associated protein Csb2 [Candidatus Poriferisodalis sp.]|uniref:type I-G CRISPR-associated protein Csb2 n=1 Tax=Candidatus Poriferisodalis sp. TaxID=3101277 RepID=UPI003C6F1614